MYMENKVLMEDSMKEIQESENMSPEAIELKESLKEYDRLESIDITIVGHCPDEGYLTYLFNYKGRYILFFDRGNGYYTFMREVPDISLLVIDTDLKAYNKHNLTKVNLSDYEIVGKEIEKNPILFINGKEQEALKYFLKPDGSRCGQVCSLDNCINCNGDDPGCRISSENRLRETGWFICSY